MWGRLEGMAAGDEISDLSDNDKAAIKRLLGVGLVAIAACNHVEWLARYVKTTESGDAAGTRVNALEFLDRPAVNEVQLLPSSLNKGCYDEAMPKVVKVLTDAERIERA